MSALVVLGGVAILLGLAYRWYGRLLARRVFPIDDTEPTPARLMRDGRDFVPAPAPIVFGHHFASIAGLGPLLGPAIAVIWGWVPALLWIVLGCIFVGGVHDLGCLYSSMRNRARSVADLAYDVAGARARVLFLVFGVFALALAMGVFVINIANLFAPGAGGVEGGHVPEAVLPSAILILLALIVGVLFYRYRVPLSKLTPPALLVSLLFVWLGVQYPITTLGGAPLTANLWTYLLLGYALLATLLPVWLLLQPRDYLNSFQLFLGMGLLFGGALTGGFTLTAPAMNLAPQGAPPMVPLLFITIACGAVSGFHSLVASGTTVRQLDKPRHALPIGYGAMLLEGLLATLALLAVAAGLGSEWQARYPDWLTAGKSALANFVHGAGALVSAVGIPVSIAKVFIATVAVGFALTTLDTGARLIRYNLQELGRAWNLAPLQNATLATLLAVGLIGFFALLKAPDPITGELKSVGVLLWQLFGASNQLLAALALLVVSLYLRAQGRPTLYTLLPMGLMLTATLTALVIGMRNFALQGNTLLLGVSALIFALAAWLVGEAFIAWRRGRQPLTPASKI
ncbi:MAG: carbon starvation protein A [Fimbriimonadales bacterium]